MIDRTEKFKTPAVERPRTRQIENNLIRRGSFGLFNPVEDTAPETTQKLPTPKSITTAGLREQAVGSFRLQQGVEKLGKKTFKDLTFERAVKTSDLERRAEKNGLPVGPVTTAQLTMASNRTSLNGLMELFNSQDTKPEEKALFDSLVEGAVSGAITAKDFRAQMSSQLPSFGNVASLIPLEFQKPKGFNKGGKVDTVPAMLTPGEFVMRKEAVQQHGVGFMKRINKFQHGGEVPGNGAAGIVSQQAITSLDTSFMQLVEKINSIKGVEASSSAPSSSSISLESLPPLTIDPSSLDSIATSVGSMVTATTQLTAAISNESGFTQAAADISGFVGDFQAAVTQLSQVELTLKVAPTQTNVTINGLEILKTMEPVVADMIKTEITKAISNTTLDNQGRLNPADVG